MPNANDLLGRPMTAEYEPAAWGGLGAHQFSHKIPPFSQWWIPYMLRDSRIRFGLRMIKGPVLSASRFYVDDPRSKGEKFSPLKQFVVRNISRFWRESAIKSLRAIEWGFSGHEALYRISRDQIIFNSLKVLHPRDVSLLTREGEKVGMSVANVKGRQGKVYIGGPKCLWHTVSREENPWYGVSRLSGAFGPWLEFYDDGGARDIRRLYFHKFAYAGDIGYYPPGTRTGADGEYGRSNKEIMRSILEKRKTGGVVMFPNERDESDQLAWRLEPATPGPGSSEISGYYADIKRDMFEGLGIPPEVVEAAEVGSGWSGRMVPATAFFSMLQELVNWLIFDFNQQILMPLVELNFGIHDPDYEIIPFGLLRGAGGEEEEERGAQVGGETGGPVPGGHENNVPPERQEASKFSLCV